LSASRRHRRACGFGTSSSPSGSVKRSSNEPAYYAVDLEARTSARVDSPSRRKGRALARLCDPRHATGCMLYWAEGSKSRNSVQFVNSDPAMVRYFVQFLRTQFTVSDEAFRLGCNLFADHVERQQEIEQFWLDTLGLPQSCLRKSTVNVYSKHSQKKRRNKLPYGTIRVCVHSTHVVQNIFGAIQEYGGFERPEWLG
jgi:hypothetical protein